MILVERHGPVIAIRMARRFLGKPLSWSAAYWVDGLLIDAGPAATGRELVRVLEQMRVDLCGGLCHQIAITHSHEEHIGGLAAVQRAYPQARIYASPRAVSIIADPAKQEMQLYRRLIWGAPQPVEGVIPLDEVEDEIRTPSYRFRAIETPGHSRDHVVYFEPRQRWVFSGDVFLSGHDRIWASEFDLFGVIASLQTLASLEPERLFSGSGQVRRTPTLDILDKINYLRQLAGQVGALTTQGKDPATIAQELFPTEAHASFWTQGHFSAVKLVEACLSYNTIFSPDGDGSTGLSAPPKPPESTRPSPKRSTDQAT